jgi:hypothetical protein
MLKQIESDSHFVASQQLVDLLLLNGYKEETEKYYPDSFKKILLKECNPHILQRYFSFSKESYIIFNYTYIEIYNPKIIYCSTTIPKDILFKILNLNKIP